MVKAALLLVALGALTGCLETTSGDQTSSMPGTPIGTYNVTATQSANSCGDGALGAPSSYSFTLSLSESDASIMYWSTGSGAIISGSLASDGVTFSFETSSITDMRTSSSTSSSSSTGVVALPACSIERDDTSSGVMVGDSTGVTSFTGSLTYAFTPTEGSSCSDLVESTSPTFAALPCSMTYALSGARQ